MNHALTPPFDTVAAELEPGERVVWRDRPSPLRLARREVGAFVGGTFLFGFAAAWIVSIAAGTAKDKHGNPVPWPVAVFALPFLGVVVALLSAPFRAMCRAGRTDYVITGRRAMIVEAGRTHRVTTYAPGTLGRLMRVERADGSGDVVIERFVTKGAKGSTQTHDVGFFGIEHVADVHDRLSALHASKGDE